ncbi:Aste57867_11136 [Aphanomyces stellatus]|uniref:Aste57867_11136 protein n=1 Tax=Aphanomyces stellatus TaxID=120398 RepID=A0A485KS28_9STRA|nr:hypothetical protein As57867_011094 [Aphanomyces stellatus]VFT88003.1 Aste57867_11136 [Aphanomyces stellatus]
MGASIVAPESPSACPYAQLPPAAQHVAVWDRALCGPNETSACVVDGACRRLGRASDVYWDAIGSYMGVPLNQSYMMFQGDGKPINIDLAAFPSHVNELSFTNIPFNLSSSIQWSSNITSLTIQIANLNAIPPVPPSVQLLFLGVNALNNVTQLRALPPTVQKLSLENNNFTALSDLDWRNMTKVYLLKNPNLRAISNVQFSRSIRQLNMDNLTLERWIMDNSTFLALNSTLRPNTTVDDATQAGGKLFAGYNYYGLSIRTDPTECETSNGVLQELWPDKTQRRFEFSTTVYTVCVLKDKMTTHAPMAILTPPPKDTIEIVTKHTLPTRTLVGLAVGIFIALFFVYWCCRRNHASSRKPERDSPRSPPPYYGSATPRHHAQSLDLLTELALLEPLRIDCAAVIISNEAHHLGSGAFANVVVGHFQGQRVAVKALQNDHATPRQIQSFIDEIKLMATFDSPCIVKLIGATWTRPSDLRCVMECMDRGDLREYLESQTPETYSWPHKIASIRAIADGLAYLHSFKVIHRDLKSRNVLLDSTHGTKLADFGVSKEEVETTMTAGIGTYRWMAPEVLQDRHYTVAADIYSFGAILSEFDTHRVPFYHLTRPGSGEPLVESAILLKVVQDRMMPLFSTDCPAWIHDMAIQCLDHNPKQRPTAMELSHLIRRRMRDAL